MKSEGMLAVKIIEIERQHQFQSREGMNKLSPTLEGPFRITEEHRPGVFRLTDKDGM